ncbi:MAG: hypothetical protein FJ008_03460 [Chloroflexi bacterium]|nr:hypothetical protein [Chloroflexota bacterium]MBM3172134.1 hypothetical protein [Chloroflexota bacterium]MBM3174589.1 hypothetical protein [Chloroflexota bacterium]MBM4449349.1 hypothetical protein [Chloroflexota bacterium]
MTPKKPASKSILSKRNRRVVADASKCAGCMSCMLRCSFTKDGDFNLSASRIQVRKLVGKENEYQITFSKDCDACGVCAVYCPYDALARVKVEEKV